MHNKSVRIIVACCSLLVLSAWIVRGGQAAEICPTCTQVIGFSQTAQWFRPDDAFLREVDAARWQLLWNSGAGVDRWQDPNYSGWNNQLFSPCVDDTAAPSRVVLTISGPYGSNEPAWAQAIENTINTIRDKIPSATTVLLQPVVGGTDPDGCPDPNDPGTRVRASWQHYHIINAINTVVGSYDAPGIEVLPGFFPKVRTCDDYADGLGHLTQAGAIAAGRTIGEYYAQWDTGGDFNGDGLVDAADYVAWTKHGRAQFGYEVWRAAFGRSRSTGEAQHAQVPEPTGMAPAALGLACVLIRRARRSRTEYPPILSIC